MCRVVGHLGAPIRLGDLVQEPEHGLYHQSYKAKELVTSVVSADGWGAGWYLPADPDPCIYRSTLPIWGDVNLSDVCRSTESHCQLAYVRSATDPLSISMANTQPFKAGPLCFVHNGYVRDFDRKVRRLLQNELSDRAQAELKGSTDSEYLFQILSDFWRAGQARNTGRLLHATKQALTLVFDAAGRAESHVLATLLVTDGRELCAVRAAYRADAPTLYLRRSDEGVRFASEPLNETPGWQGLGDAEFAVAGPGGALETGRLELGS